MIFQETKLRGAFIINVEPQEDERGLFARTFSAEEFETRGLSTRVVQCSTSFNEVKGTLRGMHYQAAPYAEAKLVRCTLGAIYDVIIDLRPDSASFMHWIAAELTADSRRMIYLPEGFAHGFQTLEDRSEVYYQISQVYQPEYARGIRWNDPSFGIRWPLENPVLSTRDSQFPDFVRPEGRSSP